MKTRTRISFCVALIGYSAATLIAICPLQAVTAATITVESTGDGAADANNCPGSGCRLRDALAKAVDNDTIDLAVTGMITLDSGQGQLVVVSNVTITGPGEDALAVDGGGATRVFYIQSGKTVTISGLTISGGVGDGYGGGIYNLGSLTIDLCKVTNNRTADGAPETLNGGTGNGGSAPGITGGGVSNVHLGGGIYNGGTLIVNSSTISNNRTGNGGDETANGGSGINSGGKGGDATGGAEPGGYGGGISNFGSLTLNNCTISGNLTGNGGKGTANGGPGSNGGTGGKATVTAGNGGYGGGVYTYFGSTLIVNNSTFSGNQTGNGGEGAAVGGNAMGSGSQGGDGFATSGNGGNGSAIASDGTLSINNSTISHNTVGTPGNVSATGGSPDVPGATGGSASGTGGFNGNGTIFASAGSVNLSSTIVSNNNGAADVVPGTTSGDYNLIQNPGGGSFSGTNNIFNVDPMLGPLQGNGGPTFTRKPGSPAIDKGKNAGSFTTDQRGSGFTRTYDDSTVGNPSGGDGTDIGAVEITPPQALSATINDSVTGSGLNQWDYTSGGWFYYSNNNFTTAYQRDEHYAFTTGVKAHFRFNGTQVKIYTVKEPVGGNIRYTLDGNADVQIVSNYSPTQMGNSLSYTSPVVSPGNHDLVIEVLGSHEPSATSNTITVDKAEVFVPASAQMLAATVNDSVAGTGNNQWDYTSGGWFYYSNNNFNTAYQKDEHYAFTTGVKAHFRFNGTQVRIYTVKEPVGGNIRYTLDGGADVQIVSNYSATQMGNSLSYVSPVLNQTDHDLVIEVLGTHEPSATSNTITVDKAEVYVPAVGPFLTTTVNDSVTGTGNNQWDYGSGWHYYFNANFTTAYQMDEHYAPTAGTTAHFRFNGTQVKIYTVKSSVGGRIKYILDTNVDMQTISNYSPTTMGNSLSYTSPIVPAGDHDLVIQCDGTHEPAASSNTITVDKAEVYSGP